MHQIAADPGEIGARQIDVAEHLEVPPGAPRLVVDIEDIAAGNGARVVDQHVDVGAGLDEFVALRLVRQIERSLRGEPLLPYRYRDFGSLVTLGEHATVGSLMGFLVGRGFFVEGLFAQLIYRSLRIMHDQALVAFREWEKSPNKIQY